jgi:hypothetical protein
MGGSVSEPFRPRLLSTLGIEWDICMDPRGKNIAQEVSATAMGVVSSFNACDNALARIVIFLMKADPKKAFDLFFSVRSDGVRRGIATKFAKAHLSAELQPAFVTTTQEMSFLYTARNVLAHWLWYSHLQRPDLLLLLHPRDAADFFSDRYGDRTPYPRQHIRATLAFTDLAELKSLMNRNLRVLRILGSLWWVHHAADPQQARDQLQAELSQIPAKGRGPGTPQEG